METKEMKTIQPVESRERIMEIWGADLEPQGCPVCRQVFLVSEADRKLACPACGAATLGPQPAVLRTEPPEMIIPFQVSDQALNTALEGFTKGVWLHTPDFTPAALKNRAVRVYLPMWMVDCTTCGRWQAELGYDYQVKSTLESYTGRGWQSREEVETRIRWEPRLGEIERRYENTPVPALSRHGETFRRAGRFDLRKAEAYQSDRLDRAAVQAPDQNPENAFPQAREQINARAAEDCRSASGGQHIRQFQIQAEYQSAHWTQLLLPVYATYYHDDEGKARLVYVNGQTGAVGGVRMASQRKGWQAAGILAGIAVLLFLLGMGGLALGAVFPPGAVLGGVVLLLAFLSGAAAIAPAVWPWLHNRSQEAELR